jgi:hypothetical protein
VSGPRNYRGKVDSGARVFIAFGPIRDALVEAARILRSDEVVIERNPRPGSMGRMKDLTHAMVRDALCSVLSDQLREDIHFVACRETRRADPLFDDWNRHVMASTLFT